MFEIIPLGEVASAVIFAPKVVAAICGLNGLESYLYWRGKRRSQIA